MNFQTASFIGLLTLVTLVFFGLVADFAQPIFWAAILAVIFYPANRRMQRIARAAQIHRGIAFAAPDLCHCHYSVLVCGFRSRW